jgi:hypothetical protein
VDLREVQRIQVHDYDVGKAARWTILVVVVLGAVILFALVYAIEQGYGD